MYLDLDQVPPSGENRFWDAVHANLDETGRQRFESALHLRKNVKSWVDTRKNQLKLGQLGPPQDHRKKLDEVIDRWNRICFYRFCLEHMGEIKVGFWDTFEGSVRKMVCETVREHLSRELDRCIDKLRKNNDVGLRNETETLHDVGLRAARLSRVWRGTKVDDLIQDKALVQLVESFKPRIEDDLMKKGMDRIHKRSSALRSRRRSMRSAAEDESDSESTSTQQTENESSPYQAKTKAATSRDTAASPHSLIRSVESNYQSPERSLSRSPSPPIPKGESSCRVFRLGVGWRTYYRSSGGLGSSMAPRKGTSMAGQTSDSQKKRKTACDEETMHASAVSSRKKQRCEKAQVHGGLSDTDKGDQRTVTSMAKETKPTVSSYHTQGCTADVRKEAERIDVISLSSDEEEEVETESLIDGKHRDDDIPSTETKRSKKEKRKKERKEKARKKRKERKETAIVAAKDESKAMIATAEKKPRRKSERRDSDLDAAAEAETLPPTEGGDPRQKTPNNMGLGSVEVSPLAVKAKKTKRERPSKGLGRIDELKSVVSERARAECSRQNRGASRESTYFPSIEELWMPHEEKDEVEPDNRPDAHTASTPGQSTQVGTDARAGQDERCCSSRRLTPEATQTPEATPMTLSTTTMREASCELGEGAPVTRVENGNPPVTLSSDHTIRQSTVDVQSMTDDEFKILMTQVVKRWGSRVEEEDPARFRSLP